MLLCIDPSLTSSGFAWFSGDRLVHVGYVPTSTRQAMAERICALAQRLRQDAYLPTRIVFEWPQIYRNQRGSDPNKLLYLSAICGAVMSRYPLAQVQLVNPREWTAQIKKHKRNQNDREKLLASERAAMEALGLKPCEKHPDHPNKCTGNDNDVMDAVGLGLWRLGR